VQHFLHAEDLVLLLFCFQLDLLVLLCLSDNFRSLYQTFLLFICLLLGDDRNQCLLFRAITFHHFPIGSQSFIDEELFADVNFHVVAVIFLDPLVEFLGLLDHLKFLALNLLPVVSQCPHSIGLKAVELDLSPDAISLKLKLNLASEF
jgi:hypothetical protein